MKQKDTHSKKEALEFTKEEWRLFRTLKNPRAIQDFLDALRYSFDKGNDALRSPRRVLRERTAHCIEGALVASAALWVQGVRPFLLDVRATDDDLDHVVTLFRVRGRWGALSKTNHAVLRYREPVYSSVRELAMSFFHEYFLDSGVKTMKDFSQPFDIVRQCGTSWMTSEENLWHIAEELDDSPHVPVLSPAHRRSLRLADPIEIAAGKLRVEPEPRR